MAPNEVVLILKSHDGKVTIHTEIPVSGEADVYVVTVAVVPRLSTQAAQSQTLDNLYGALKDAPLPEIISDPLPEQRDLL